MTPPPMSCDADGLSDGAVLCPAGGGAEGDEGAGGGGHGGTPEQQGGQAEDAADEACHW